MIATRSGRTGRLALLLSLYFAQGLPFGLFTQALPVFMRQSGQSLEAIGLANLLALPWALKFLWSPVIDRVQGHRRRVILPLNAVATALLFALAFVAPGALLPLVLTVLLCNFAAATQDIATDGYAVELLHDDERGAGNGVQVAGYRLGMVVGGGAILGIFERIGWTASFLTAAGCVALASLPLFFAPNAPRVSTVRPRFADAMLHTWFAEPGAGRWFLLLALYKLGDAFGTGMAKPLLVDLGMSLPQIGVVVGIYGSLASMAGAAIGGLCLDRFGRKNALMAFAGAQVVTMGLYVGVATFGGAWIVPAVVAEHLFSGMATASLFAVMMGAVRPGRAGVDYTVQASVQVTIAGLAAIASGWSASHLGYEGHFVLATLFCVLPVVLVATWPKDAPERFRL